MVLVTFNIAVRFKKSNIFRNFILPKVLIFHSRFQKYDSFLFNLDLEKENYQIPW